MCTVGVVEGVGLIDAVDVAVTVGLALSVGYALNVGYAVGTEYAVKVATDEFVMYPVVVATGYAEKVGTAIAVIVGMNAVVGVGRGPASATCAAETACATAPRDEITPAA